MKNKRNVSKKKAEALRNRKLFRKVAENTYKTTGKKITKYIQLSLF